MFHATAFPHILDRILDLSPPPTLVALRPVSRDLYARASARLFNHVLLQWDNYGADLRITTPEPPHMPLPIPRRPRTLRRRLQLLRIALNSDPTPGPRAYDLASHIDPAALRATRILDVLDHSYPAGSEDPPPPPPLPALEVARACFPQAARTNVLYMNIRAPPGQRVRHGLGGGERNAATRPPLRWVVHLFFDQSWSECLRGLKLLNIRVAESVALVLHPATRGSAAGPWEWPRDIQLGRFFSLTGSVPYTLVGLETVPPEMLGLPPKMVPSEVQAHVAALPGGVRLQFASLAEWSRENAIAAEVPQYMVAEVARAVSLQPLYLW